MHVKVRHEKGVYATFPGFMRRYRIKIPHRGRYMLKDKMKIASSWTPKCGIHRRDPWVAYKLPQKDHVETIGSCLGFAHNIMAAIFKYLGSPTVWGWRRGTRPYIKHKPPGSLRKNKKSLQNHELVHWFFTQKKIGDIFIQWGRNWAVSRFLEEIFGASNSYSWRDIHVLLRILIGKLIQTSPRNPRWKNTKQNPNLVGSFNLQPIWKILVNLDHLPQRGMKIKNVWNHQVANRSKACQGESIESPCPILHVSFVHISGTTEIPSFLPSKFVERLGQQKEKKLEKMPGSSKGCWMDEFPGAEKHHPLESNSTRTGRCLVCVCFREKAFTGPTLFRKIACKITSNSTCPNGWNSKK